MAVNNKRECMDIKKHNFSDTDLYEVEIGGGDNDEYLRFLTQELNEFTMTKDDVIALAQHFNVTEIDLIS